MAAPISALLLDAPVGRHFAQLHTSPESRNRCVSLFLETGLRRGQPVVVIAAADNLPHYLERIRAAGVDVDAALRTGQLTTLDASDTLKRFMTGALPDWAEFRRVVGGVIEDARRFSAVSVRAYGEMVNLLWHRGERAAALRLEHFWNDLAQLYPFSLFCTYMIDSHDPAGYDGPLAGIAHEHCEVIGTEEDARLHESLDIACRDLYGVSVTQLMRRADDAPVPGEDKLPPGRRTTLWMLRNMPSDSREILARSRRYFAEVSRGGLTTRES